MRHLIGLFLTGLLVSALLLGLRMSGEAQLLYGGNGGHGGPPSMNEGSLVIIDPTTAAVTAVGHPAGVARLSGLAFDSSGALFGTTQIAGGFPPPPGPTSPSSLIRIDPLTGDLISTISAITDTTNGQNISIADLAVQPGTDTLFGIRGPNDQLGGQGILYTINKTTGLATRVGNTGDFLTSIAFAPNGTLYMSSADLDMMGNLTNISLKTLNPANAAVLTTVPTVDFFGAFGIRPTDGAIFGGKGDAHQLFRINPLTGGETLIGDTGNNFEGDLAFRPTPEPGACALLLASGLAGSGLLLRRFRRRPAKH